MTPIGAFAQRSTREGLRKFRSRLKQATRRPQDPESIHDLRVSIRRLRQCLTVFDDLLRSKPTDRMQRRLQKLMKRCGAVRNCDIALELLQESSLSYHHPIYSELLSQRQSAEKKLIHQLGKKRWRTFPERLPLAGNALETATKWDPEDSVERNAARTLEAMRAEFFTTGAAAMRARDDYRALHQFRIHTKHFRYTLELFGKIYVCSIERKLKDLRDLQDHLGRINDCRTACELVENSPDAQKMIRKLLVVRDRQLDRLWKSKFAPRAERAWQNWLARSSPTGNGGS